MCVRMDFVGVTAALVGGMKNHISSRKFYLFRLCGTNLFSNTANFAGLLMLNISPESKDIKDHEPDYKPTISRVFFLRLYSAKHPSLSVTLFKCPFCLLY